MAKPNKYISPFPLSGEPVEHQGTVYRLATLDDCFHFRQYVDSLDGFQLHVDSNNVLVWDKKVKGESMNPVKVFGTFDCKPEILYAVLQDPIYRETWDESRLEGFKLARLDERQEIGYYAAKSPATGVSSRDFLAQRIWHATKKGEYVIFNTAAQHTAVPEGREKRVRGYSKMTGYFVQPWRDGCSLTYITQCDPGGWIPHFVMNFVTTKYAPKVIDNLRKACSGYEAWLAKQETKANGWELTPSDWPVDPPTKTHSYANHRWVDGDQSEKLVPVSVREGDAEAEAGAEAD
eukprot:GILI01016205.1.p1 GENE.GILI01016205.1~~GILI01016205.1.p1  ORF type:complete len:291 (-),score=34.97 GILI01016205.1:108-980(-)